MWVKKYRPRSLKEFVGHRDTVDVFLSWAGRWKPGGRPMLFSGPPGVGKTALVEAYANENDLDVIEVNASDCRNAEELKREIGNSVTQKSLFRKGRIFLIDEADGLAGREDRGGVGELIRIISETKSPVVITCNNPYHPKLRELRNYCDHVQFKRLASYDIEKKLKEICGKEGVKCEEAVLGQIANMSNGDLRSAINDLEMLSKGKGEIGLGDIEKIGHRERERSIFDALKILFKTRSVLGAKLSIENVDSGIDDVFWWVENNISNEYEDLEEIARAYDVLSKADMFRQRISYTQNWKLMSYMIDMMTAGVSQAKKGVYRKFTRYEYPRNIMMLGRTKEARKSAREVMDAFSKHLHASGRKVKAYYMPYFRQMAGDKGFVAGLSSGLGLEREDVAELLKSD